MLKKYLFIPVLLVLVIAGGVSAQDSIRIGAIFDLSGPTSDVGRPYAEGVAAYVDFVNASGGINGQPIDLQAVDYAYDTNTAVRAYSQFASEGMVAFLGWGTDDTVRLTESAARDEIPFISASYSESLNDPNGDAPYNFVVGTTYSDQITIMLAYMAALWRQAGDNPADMSVAILHDDSAFGTDPLNSAADAADVLGIGDVLPIKLARRATDFTAELQQADDYGVTHIIIQSTSGIAAIIARNVSDFWGQGRVVVGCLNWCADELFIESAGAAAEGVLGALPFAPTSVRVDGQSDPSAYLADRGIALDEATLRFTQGWATAAILIEAIAEVDDAGFEVNGPNIRAALETFRDMDTGDLLPPISFTASDHRGTRALAIYEVVNGRWQQASDQVDLR